MVKNYPNIFRKSRSILQSSYDYIDIATGRNYKILYLGTDATSGAGVTYRMFPTTFHSAETVTESQSSGSITHTIHINKTFDMDIEKPIILDGVGIVTIPVQQVADSGTGLASYAIEAEVLRTTNGASTALISDISEWNEGDNETSSMETVFLTIPRTRFKKGDQLNLHVKLWGTSPLGGTTKTWVIAHDPENLEAVRFTDDNVVTNAQFHIPIVHLVPL